MQKISKDDFDSWLENPITLGVIKLLKDEAEAHRFMAASGQALGSTTFERIGEKYFTLINTAMVYENLLANLTYDNIFPKEENNDEVSSSWESSSY